MSNPLEFIAGRAGSRKTTLLFSRIRSLLDKGERAVLIVPEQFTFESERRLAESLESGLLDAVVFSFTTLASKVLRETGDNRVFLSHQGKLMMIRKALEEHKPDLKVYGRIAGKPGFTAECDRLFTRLKRFLITPGMLRSAAEYSGAPDALSAKLCDLALLYECVEGHLASRYMDGEDIVNSLIDRMGRSGLCGAHVFVDGFEFLTEQKYRVLARLMEVAASMTVTVCVDFSGKCRDRGLFTPGYGSYERLRQLGEEQGCRISMVNMERNGKEGYSAELSHMEGELFAQPPAPYSNGGGHIAVFTASGIRAEAEAVCNAIVHAAQEGVRYRDMAVIVSDMETYAPLLNRTMRRYRIPFFMDLKRPLDRHPISVLLLSALKCIVNGFSQTDVLELLKCGLLNIDRDSAEQFENHILKFGLRGTRLFEPIEAADVSTDIEHVRSSLINPLLKLRRSLSQAGSSMEKTKALYSYMCEMDVYGSLNAIVKSLREDGELELAEETAQAWDAVIELLDQLYAIMGDVRVSTRRYMAVLEEGLSAYKVGVIPTTADQVLVGDIDRTCAMAVSRLFVVGCCEGLFPKKPSEDGVINDAELAFLRSAGLPTWETSAERASGNVFGIYNALSKAKERLWLSYTASAGVNGGIPSSVIDRLRELFTIDEQTDVGGGMVPSHPQAGLAMLAKEMRRLADTGSSMESCRGLYAWFKASPKYRSAVNDMEKALFFSPYVEPFGRDMARLMYGSGMQGSATRFETFNSCPFRHFMRFGMRAYMREEFKERSADKGVFYHEALDGFMRLVIDRSIDLDALTYEDVEGLLAEVFDVLVPAHNRGVLVSSPRAEAECAVMKRTVKATAWAAVQQMKRGGFKPEKSEVTFGLGGTYPPLELRLDDGTVFLVTGKIDRMDASRNGGRYIRVIDYKTGGMAFDYGELFLGLKLQLPLYVAAIMAAGCAADIAGMYYMPVTEPKLEDVQAEEKLEELLLKAFRLSGITVNELDVIGLTDNFEGASSIIEARRNKDGVFTGRGLVPSNGMRAVVDFSKRRAIETLRDIMNGHAEAAPYSYGNNKSACDWCDYAGVCMFDAKFRGCSMRRIIKMDKAGFFDGIGGNVDDR